MQSSLSPIDPCHLCILDGTLNMISFTLNAARKTSTQLTKEQRIKLFCSVIAESVKALKNADQNGLFSQIIASNSEFKMRIIKVHMELGLLTLAICSLYT